MMRSLVFFCLGMLCCLAVYSLDLSMNTYSKTVSQNINQKEFFQLYHISKCGGTNMRSVIKSTFNLKPPSTQRWFEKEFGIWRRESENQPDPRYGRDPNNPLKQKVFIMGLVRNPFGYYRSLYLMFLTHPAYEGCYEYMRAPEHFENGKHVCMLSLMLRATQINRTSIFLAAVDNRHSVTETQHFIAFNDFVYFLHTSVPDKHSTMQVRHDNLMLMKDGSFAYDAVVKQENYYEMTREALTLFDQLMPGVTQFEIFDEIAAKNSETFTRKTIVKYPDYCYYSDSIRELVLERDSKMMEAYNYTWDNFMKGSAYEDCGETLNRMRKMYRPFDD